MKKSKGLLAHAKNRFYAQVLLPNENGCMIWIGYKTLSNHRGYGEFTSQKNRKLAHHYSYELHNGSIPKGLLVLHRCDIRNCVAPDHLFLGTAKDNAVDRNNKRRNHEPAGEDQYLAKFTNEKVREIRATYQKGGFTTRQLAKKYNVSQCTIQYMLAHKTYKTA